MLEGFDEAIRGAGAWALPLLAIGAALEYLFPPFPGDAVTVFGGLYAVRGGWPIPLVFAAVMGGSLAGALGDYAVGRWLSGRIDRAHEGNWLMRRVPRERIRDWEARFRHRGLVWLAINRFLPGIRGPIFLAAGVARIPLLKVVLWGGVSALLWNALLFAAGYAVGGEAERLARLLRLYGRFAWTALVVVALALLARWLWRRRHASAATRPPGAP